MNQHLIRTSTFEELLARNVSKPANVIRIKKNLTEILSILMNGYGYEGISSYCQLTEKTTVSRTVYYDYLHIIDIVLRKLAIEICLEKLNEAKNQQIMYVGFDSSWAHRRDADHCLGILMDLKTNYIICFELVHHGKETEETLSSTDKHSKCMEGIALTQIIDRSQLNTIKNLTFVHDCDLSDHKLIEQMLPNAIIKFDPNHLCKKTKKIIAKVCQDDVDLRDLSEKIENYYSILIHERNISNEEKHEKWKNVTNCFIENEYLSEEFNGDAIQKLNKLISDISDTFDQIDPELSSNPIESFNHSRASLANKNIAYRISWRIRAYISIIKWNSKLWKEKIFEVFQLSIPESIKIKDISNNTKPKKRITTKPVIDERILKARKKKMKKNKYKLMQIDKMIHDYSDEKKSDDSIESKKKKTQFSGYQKWIIEAISSRSTEDKPYIKLNTIANYLIQYHDLSENKRLKFIIKSQITRLINYGVIKQKKDGYKLL